MSLSMCVECKADTAHLCAGCGMPYCVFCLLRIEVAMGHECPLAEHENVCSMAPDDHILHLCSVCYAGAAKRGAV